MDSRVPAQSQPRNNFSLLPLNSNKETQSRCRSSPSVKSSAQKPHPLTEFRPQESQRPSPLNDPASEQPVLVSRSHSMKSESGTKRNGSKILIKIPCKNDEKNQEKQQREKGAGENKEKKKLSFEISLTQLEIEEDIYSFTGLRPNRRPKKRAKNIQKKLDEVFPGSWLESITPDSYKVSKN